MSDIRELTDAGRRVFGALFPKMYAASKLPRPPKAKCPRCDGTGRAWRMVTGEGFTNCPLCKGWGTVYADPSPAEDCPKCERGLVECFVEGSESKTYRDFCDCPLGQRAKANTNDALEARGVERAR